MEINRPWDLCSARNDTESFKVDEACCYCGGGEFNWGGDRPDFMPARDDSVRLQTAEVCFDTDYYRDSRGKDCRYYAQNDTTKEECGSYDSVA